MHNFCLFLTVGLDVWFLVCVGFCCATEDASPMMILEFMQFGDLQSFLVHNKPNSKSSGLSISIFYSIAADVSL